MLTTSQDAAGIVGMACVRSYARGFQLLLELSFNSQTNCP